VHATMLCADCACVLSWEARRPQCVQPAESLLAREGCERLLRQQRRRQRRHAAPSVGLPHSYGSAPAGTAAAAAVHHATLDSGVLAAVTAMWPGEALTRAHTAGESVWSHLPPQLARRASAAQYAAHHLESDSSAHSATHSFAVGRRRRRRRCHRSHGTAASSMTAAAAVRLQHETGSFAAVTCAAV
jgi:hypothetical protein